MKLRSAALLMVFPAMMALTIDGAAQAADDRRSTCEAECISRQMESAQKVVILYTDRALTAPMVAGLKGALGRGVRIQVYAGVWDAQAAQLRQFAAARLQAVGRERSAKVTAMAGTGVCHMRKATGRKPFLLVDPFAWETKHMPTLVELDTGRMTRNRKLAEQAGAVIDEEDFIQCQLN